MTKFCEGCPMRGRATGEIDGLFSDVAEFSGPLFMRDSSATGGVFVDTEQNLSVPIIVPELESVESLCERIEECESPQPTIFGRLLRKDNLVYCPALNSMRLDSREASSRMLTLMRGSLMRLERLPMSRINESKRFESVQE